jgi:hypothetical protein
MKLPVPGKKLGFGVACIVGGLVAMGFLKPDKAPSVVMLVVGVYTAFVGGHSATDIMSTKVVTKETKDSDKC